MLYLNIVISPGGLLPVKLKLKLDSDSGERKNTSFFEALAEAQVISTALSTLFMKQDSTNEVCLCPRCICMLCLSSLFCSRGLLSMNGN